MARMTTLACLSASSAVRPPHRTALLSARTCERPTAPAAPAAMDERGRWAAVPNGGLA